MKWWGAIWAAILAFFKFLIVGNKDKPEEGHVQEQQDQIVEEAQHEIEEVPNKTDDELTETAQDLGLVKKGD